MFKSILQIDIVDRIKGRNVPLKEAEMKVSFMLYCPECNLTFHTYYFQVSVLKHKTASLNAESDTKILELEKLNRYAVIPFLIRTAISTRPLIHGIFIRLHLHSILITCFEKFERFFCLFQSRYEDAKKIATCSQNEKIARSSIKTWSCKNERLMRKEEKCKY